MESTIEFSPVIPSPTPFDVQKRIQELRDYLDPNKPHYQPEEQHLNVKAAIKLYEDSKIDGKEQVFMMNGKVVDRDEIFKGPFRSWFEGMFHQYAQMHACGHGSLGAHFHEVSIGLLFNARNLSFGSDSHAT